MKTATNPTESDIIALLTKGGRTWAKIVLRFAGLRAVGGTLADAYEETIRRIAHLLGEMVRAGTLNRTGASDMRDELYELA